MPITIIFDLLTTQDFAAFYYVVESIIYMFQIILLLVKCMELISEFFNLHSMSFSDQMHLFLYLVS